MLKKISHYWLWFGLILILASIFRLYRLGQVPHGMSWDEAAVGYNGYAIFTTRRDEWLERLPVSFKSFGDYKSPLGIYLNGPFVYFLGSKLWVVRLPFALAGILAVAAMMLLTRELITQMNADNFSLISGFLMAVSPWQINFSRIGFDSGMVLCFVLWGMYFWLKLIWRPNSWRQNLLYGSLSAAMLSASLYVYHSAKIVVPLLLVVSTILLIKNIKFFWKWVILTGLILTLLIYPLAQDALWGHGRERFDQASFFNKGLTPIQMLGQFSYSLFSHFNPYYLIGGQTTTLRHGDGVYGVLFPTELLLIIAGLLLLIVRQRSSNLWLYTLAFSWLLIGLLPAAIGTDVPHSSRTMLSYPGFNLLILLGLSELILAIKNSRLNQKISGTHQEKNILISIFIGTLLLVHLAWFINYQHHYYTVFAQESADDFSDGYLEALDYVIPYEKGYPGFKKVDQVVFSNAYGQPYIYALFKRRTNPIWYRGGSLNTFFFADSVNSSDLNRPNTIVVASNKDQMGDATPTKIIYDSNGQIKFRIYLNQ